MSRGFWKTSKRSLHCTQTCTLQPANTPSCSPIDSLCCSSGTEHIALLRPLLVIGLRSRTDRGHVTQCLAAKMSLTASNARTATTLSLADSSAAGNDIKLDGISSLKAPTRLKFYDTSSGKNRLVHPAVIFNVREGQPC